MKFKYGGENTLIPIPQKKENDMFAIANKVLGGSRIDVHSEDGKTRLARIPGRMKRRMGRIKMGDLLIISPWKIQDEKADIIHRYRKNHVGFLIKRNMLPKEVCL